MNSNAQEFSTKIEGRVYSNHKDVAATHVSNSTQNRGTITDANGFFNITVKFNDTLVFSAVQFKKKEVVITLEILKKKKLEVFLEEALTELNEVVVTPYNLTGDIKQDAKSVKVGNIITASTLGLPNANIEVTTRNERKLFEAKDGAYLQVMNVNIILNDEKNIEIPNGVAINIKRILNDVIGRTKTLKNLIELDKNSATLNEVKRVYHDSIYQQELKIPKENLNDFMNFCEVDSSYVEVVESNDALQLWEFLMRNSVVYRKNNKLD